VGRLQKSLSPSLKLANVVAVGTGEDLQSKLFEKLVSEKTGGKLTIDVSSGGSLGGTSECIQGLKAGIADLVMDSFSIIYTFSTLKGGKRTIISWSR